MDAYFWSDGDISLHIDNVKVMNYSKDNADKNGQGALHIEQPQEEKPERIILNELPSDDEDGSKANVKCHLDGGGAEC